MSVAGDVVAVPVTELRRMIATVPEISDTIMTAFIARGAILLPHRRASSA